MATCVPNVTGKATCARTASPALVDLLRIEFTSVSEMTVPWGTVIVPLCGAGSCAAGVCSCPVDVVTGTCAPQSEAIDTRATRRAAKRAIRTECDRIFIHPFHLERWIVPGGLWRLGRGALGLRRRRRDRGGGENEGRRRTRGSSDAGSAWRAGNHGWRRGGRAGDGDVGHAGSAWNRGARRAG